MAALVISGLSVSQIVQAPPAAAFGTISGLGPNGIYQHAEHEMITRAALECAPGAKSDGSCFEPNSIAQLAGQSGTFGAVGAPDINESSEPRAHCDNADYLNVPGYDSKETADTAKAALLACINWLKGDFSKGVTDAKDLLDANGILQGSEVDLTSSCTFLLDVDALGRAKCNALEGFGAALHGAQDFYAHSNWADQSDPSKPPSVTNPPGLNLSAPSSLLDLKDAVDPVIPDGLITGFFSGIYSDKCQVTNTRVTHACLNKDEAIITVDPGKPDNGHVGVVGEACLFPSDPCTTVRGMIGDNEQKAVTAAIVETRRQWDDFRAALISKYGATDAQTMILALTQDVPKVDLSFVIDTTGSMSPYIQGVVDNAQSIIDSLNGSPAADPLNGTASPRPVDYRISVTDFKDVDSCPSAYDAEVDLPFSSDSSAITSAIDALPGMVGGGCDIPEDGLSGVNAALNLPWRSGVIKAIVLMTDAPGKDPEPHSGLTSDSVIAKANALDPVSIYPILVGSDPAATAFVTKLATGTGGQVFDSNTAGGTGQAIINAITAIAAAPPAGDTTPPAVTVSFPSAPAGQNGIFNATQAPVTGTVTATDASGIAAISCLDGGGGLTQGSLAVDASGKATATLTVTGDGEHVIDCTATDASPTGNGGAADGSAPTAALLIDGTPPTMACSVSPATLSPVNGQLVNVNATVSVNDAFSGPGNFTLQSVTSSDPNTDNSIQGFTVGTASTSGQLRAESGSAGRTYTLTYQGTDAAGNTAACTATVTVAPTVVAPNGITVDTMVNTQSVKADDHITSAPVTTSKGGELLLAFVVADRRKHGRQDIDRVTGGGLIWTLATRDCAKDGGTAEVWTAYAKAPLTNARIEAKFRPDRKLQDGSLDAAITVVAFTGAAQRLGATATRAGDRGAATVTVTTAGAGDQVWAMGHDWSHAATPTLLSGQALVALNLDPRTGASSWVQRAGTIPARGTRVTVGTSAPTRDHWEMIAVDIRPV